MAGQPSAWVAAWRARAGSAGEFGNAPVTAPMRPASLVGYACRLWPVVDRCRRG